MRSSWVDSVANVESLASAVSGNNSTTSKVGTAAASRCEVSSFFCHLCNRPTLDPHAPSQPNDDSTALRSSRNPAPSNGNHWISSGGGHDVGCSSYGGGCPLSGGGGGWRSRTGGLDQGRDWKVNPFGNEDDKIEAAFNEQQNTGINFDANEEIPVETSGDNVAPAANTFFEIDLG